ncbi:MAG: sugar transferase [Chloroflexi bacterium]|nr:sugar transferase [Chloroflexota bacterium]
MRGDAAYLSAPERAWLRPEEVRRGWAYEATKRALDVTIAALVLGGLAPLWLLLAALVRLTSPGPALYRGTVVGRGGRPFTYYKLRTMAADGDASTHRAFIAGYVRADQPFAEAVDAATGQHRPVYKVLGDERVTPLGRWLRRTSLDEVPQLVNVLRGEMSLVGPRPPVLYEHELYDDWAKQRLLVRPGITGVAQVRARGRASFSQMVALDLAYIRQRSLWLDLRILLATPQAMLRGA